MTSALMILAVIFVLFGLLYLAMWLRGKKIDEMYPDDENKIEISKDDDFETILKKFEVPEDYHKIVISQSRSYSVVNCPAVIWKEEDKVKVLVLKSQPFLKEEDLEDFKYIASSPYVNFRQYDGTEYPDWAKQSDEIKELFLPCIEMTVSPGGIDRTRQQYWAGTICVYAPSLAMILKMLGNPLSYYEMTIENEKRMWEDGSIPKELRAEYRAEKRAQAEEAKKTESSKDMEAVWEAIKRLEGQKSEDVSAVEINKLNAYLLDQKRYEDLERSTKDKEFQKKLLDEMKNS